MLENLSNNAASHQSCYLEIDNQTDSVATEFEISQQLSFMYWKNVLNAFQLENN